MIDKHQINPPPELIKEWIREANHNEQMFPQVAILAARWGADQELEACCEWLRQNGFRWEIPTALRDARRPKPLTQKEIALALVKRIQGSKDVWDLDELEVVRKALEALPND